jgi:hypothetical protein
MQTQQTHTWMSAAAAIVALTILNTLLGMSDLTTAVCTCNMELLWVDIF